MQKQQKHKYLELNEIDREKLIEDAKRANERLEKKLSKYYEAKKM